MKLAFKIALRYLFSKKSTNAINIISMVSMVGMGLGAFALIVLLSVFNGFENLVLDLQNSFYADIEVKAVKGKTFLPTNDFIDKITSTKDVDTYCFILEENAYLKYEDKEKIATVKGVGENFYAVSRIESNIAAGKATLKEKGINYAILGSGIDYVLGTNVNNPLNPIRINIPKKGKSTAVVASQLFNSGQVMPGGVFLIQSEFDNKYMIIPLLLMRKITKTKDAISSIEIKTVENSNLSKVKKELSASLGDGFSVTPRNEQDKALYKAMQAERWAVFAILGLIMFIISFNIVGSLSMISIEKKKDISILKAMGLKKQTVKQIFIIQGVLGAVLGAIIGLALGLLILGAQKMFGFIGLPSNGGFVIDSYPVHIRIEDIMLSFLMVVVISVIASFYPAKKAAEEAFSFVKE
ncbi:MAG: lipoprotein-releasing system permease protein [Planctomycetota bacterium]|jgi:lipoprotein-releasing system permease protein